MEKLFFALIIFDIALWGFRLKMRNDIYLSLKSVQRKEKGSISCSHRFRGSRSLFITVIFEIVPGVL